MKFFSQSAGCCRFVWNKALAIQKERIDNHEFCLKYTEMAGKLTSWKKQPETTFLNESPSQSLQQTLKDLDRALKDAFSKSSPKQFPVFKKKGLHNSFRIPQGFKFEDDKIFLPKIGWVRFFKSREITGTPKNVTVSKRGGHWFFSVQTEMEVSDPVHPSTSTIGIDVGVKRFATLSDGSFIEPLSSFKKLESKLTKEQRRLSRKVKFSNNWKKQKHKVSKVHIKIADARNDFLHKTSTTICKNHAVVMLEDLKISNMVRSAKGTLESPGQNVKAKSGLNKSILDQGWFEFRRQIEYKQTWSGGQVVVVPPNYTSQTCPVCGNVSRENRLSQSNFRCVECGFQLNADHNAACNILAVGQTVLARGETGAVRPLARESHRL